MKSTWFFKADIKHNLPFLHSTILTEDYSQYPKKEDNYLLPYIDVFQLCTLNIYVCIYVCMYVYIYMCVYVCV